MVKISLQNFLYSRRDPDNHQNLISRCVSHVTPFRTILSKFVHCFLSYTEDRQTDRQRQIHNLLGGGNKKKLNWCNLFWPVGAIFIYPTFERSFRSARGRGWIVVGDSCAAHSQTRGAIYSSCCIRQKAVVSKRELTLSVAEMCIANRFMASECILNTSCKLAGSNHVSRLIRFIYLSRIGV